MKASIEAQGSLLSLTVKGFKSKPNPHSSKRGIIHTFSRASRRRLMRFMARLKVRKIRATFITLTFSGVPNVAEAKRAFKQFSMRLRRLFPQASVVWRMEFQERKSAHFHLLCFNLPFWKQAEVQMAWEACTGEVRSIVDIRLVHGARSVMSYVSKYIAKVADDLPSASLDDVPYQHEGEMPALGRFWGYINKECLPLGEKIEGILTDRDTIKRLSSFMWKLAKAENEYNSLSAHLFCDNAKWLCERAIEEGGMWPWECEYNTKDLTTSKPTYDMYTSRFSEAELQLDYEPLTIGSCKAERSELVQPCIRRWVAPSSKASSASRVSPYFDECGKVV